jgi:hypothetical protein
MVLIRSMKPPYRERNVPPRVADALVGRGYERVETPVREPLRPAAAAKRSTRRVKKPEPDAPPPPPVEETEVVGTVEPEPEPETVEPVDMAEGSTYMRRDMQAED